MYTTNNSKKQASVPVIVESQDANGDPVTDSADNPAVNTSGEITNYPTFPENDYKILNGTVGTDAGVAITAASLHGYHSGMFYITGITTDVINVTMLDDLGALMGVPLVIANSAPTTVVAATGLTTNNESYVFAYPINCATMLFTKVGATDTVTITGQMSGAC